MSRLGGERVLRVRHAQDRSHQEQEDRHSVPPRAVLRPRLRHWLRARLQQGIPGGGRGGGRRHLEGKRWEGCCTRPLISDADPNLDPSEP
jgi:hypothetical protein